MLSLLWAVTFGSYGQKQAKSSFEVYGINIDTLAQMVHKHPKYFEHLKKTWLENPLKVSDDQLILLYYGSAFMKDYHPKTEDKAIETVALKTGELDFETAVKEGEKLKKIYPLSARLYMLLGYAYKQTGMPDKSKFYYRLYGKILRVPLYSGTGKSFEKAYIVRITGDEFLILNHLDLELLLQELRYHRQIPFDVMRIKPRSKENKRIQNLPKEKLYFNVYLPVMIGQGKTYQTLQEEARRKYKLQD